MKFKIHQITDANDFHPIQKMGRRKSTHCVDDQKPAKTARASTRFKPGSSTASYGRAGHSSYWD